MNDIKKIEKIEKRELNYKEFEKIYIENCNNLMTVTFKDALCDLYSSILSDLECRYPNYFCKVEKIIEKTF